MIIIAGKPIPKKRPRFKRMGNFVKTYNSQRKEMDATIMEIKQQWKGEPLEGAVHVRLLFSMPIPKGTSKKKRESMFLHTKKPDLDNLTKYIMDCMNGIVFKDDSQVSTLTATKVYLKEPYTQITVF
jgi:Holliday junction resolvase RusA-like endonuclease